MALALGLTGCSSTVETALPKTAGGPLVAGEPTWPEDVVHQADRIDRICAQRQAALLIEQEEAQKSQQKFKTVMGSITGGIGTVGGAIGGVGAFVIDSPETTKQLASITGVATAGLGAIGSVLTLVLKPGDEKLKNATEALTTIGQKKEAARTALKKDPSTWTETDKAAWEKAQKDLETVCK